MKTQEILDPQEWAETTFGQAQLQGNDIWQECIKAIGPSTASSVRVHVGDRGADIFEFLYTCRSLQTHFVVRADQNRRVQTADESIEHLFEQVRGLPTQDHHPFDVPASRVSMSMPATISTVIGSVLCPVSDTTSRTFLGSVGRVNLFYLDARRSAS